MRRLRLVLQILLLPPTVVGGLACAALAGIAHLGRVSLDADIASHFAPLYLAGGLITVGVAVHLTRGVRRGLLLAVGAVAVLAAGALMAPEFARSTGERAPANGPGEIKLIQANIWWNSHDFGRTVDWLAAQDADLIVLQETTPEFRRLLDAEGLWQVSGRGREVMILSRLPKAPGPQPRLNETAPVAVARFEGPAGPFAVVGAHYAWPTDIPTQQAQEARVARLLEALPGDRNILAGDLNSTPWSFSRRRWDERFGLIRRDRALFSWPALHVREAPWLAGLPLLPLDHVYAGPGWRTVSVKRGPRLGADHYPVVVILAPR